LDLIRIEKGSSYGGGVEERMENNEERMRLRGGYYSLLSLITYSGPHQQAGESEEEQREKDSLLNIYSDFYVCLPLSIISFHSREDEPHPRTAEDQKEKVRKVEGKGRERERPYNYRAIVSSSPPVFNDTGWGLLSPVLPPRLVQLFSTKSILLISGLWPGGILLVGPFLRVFSLSHLLISLLG